MKSENMREQAAQKVVLRAGKAVLREQRAGKVIELPLRAVAVDLQGDGGEPELEIAEGALSAALIAALIEEVIVPGIAGSRQQGAGSRESKHTRHPANTSGTQKTRRTVRKEVQC
jgi:hypothetical protein